jgi:molecular chaperone DnaJ
MLAPGRCLDKSRTGTYRTMAAMRDYYRILRVAADAGDDEIRRAYRRLARTHHPDVAGDSGTETFRELKQAYDTLSNHEQRRAYDAMLARERCQEAGGVRPADWFADEVGVDFPSVDALLDQIRDAFFGRDEVAPPLSAEILLTPGEAFRGVRVPLRVPIRRTCPACGGRGEVWMDCCARCAGSGNAIAHHEVELVLPAGVRHGTRFRFSVTPPYAPSTFVEVRIAIQ